MSGHLQFFVEDVTLESFFDMTIVESMVAVEGERGEWAPKSVRVLCATSDWARQWSERWGGNLSQ